MNVRLIVLALSLLGCINNGALASNDLLWLSDVAPKRTKAAAEAGHHAQGAAADNIDAVINGEEGDNVHGGTKRLWLRQGDDPANAAYSSAAGFSADLNLLDARGNRTHVTPTPVNGLAHAKCEFADLGFYNAYLSRETLSSGVRRVQLAKAEMLKGSCCMKTGDVAPEQNRAIFDPEQPLEIVREHEPDEKLFTRIVSGDKIRLTIRRHGEPAKDVAVTMLTQQGWQKKAVSDDAGHVEFTMIRDYFPAWSDFKRRTKESFLIVAEMDENTAGVLDGQPYAKVSYQATLSGRYAPSPYDYKSYAWGLGISTFVLAFGGLGIYLYRRRRLRPFKEVRFNEPA